jgi:hypothetical protein
MNKLDWLIILFSYMGKILLWNTFGYLLDDCWGINIKYY